MATQRIGWIGLGNMGTPMVKNLLKAGFDVTVHNRTASKVAPLQESGASLAATPRALMAAVDIVITMVSDDAAVRQLHEGEDGLLAGAGAGKIVIDMSTVSPATTKELAAPLAAKGVAYLDAPVSGSVKPAELGQLVIIAGGKKEVYEAALPIFEKLGKISFLMGELGSGNNAKLGINLFLAFTMQGLAEMVNFAEEKGVSREKMLAVVGESAVNSAFAKLKTPNLVSGQYPTAFALKHMVKDLQLVKAQGLHTPGGLVLEDTFRRAQAAGLGEEDLSAILKFFGSGAQ